MLMLSGGAESPIDVHEEDQDDRLTKRRNVGYDWIPIASPKYDFEYQLPKFGEENPRYTFSNLSYDDRKNPRFRWPSDRKHPVKFDFVAVDKLLFTDERNFLINNSGHQFPAAHLQDKILAILILPLLPTAKDRTRIEHFIGVLKAAYAELRSSNCRFEVVFVTKEGEVGHDKTHFDDLFNLMPWLAIPYSDSKARKCCNEYFQPDGPVTCFTLQTNGYILQDWQAIFTIYGAKGFPFTDQRAEELENKNLRFFTDPPSMKDLLGDSIISPQGVQVPSAHLENKVVGLLFHMDPDIIKWLRSAWNEVKALHAEFEIVVVHTPYHASFEYSLLKQDGPLPWYSLQDISPCQKLWWIYHPTVIGGISLIHDRSPGALVTIGPQHNKFFSYYAIDVWYKFGAEAYPFTLERALEVLKEKLMKLELSSVLGKEHLVCAADREKVTPVSELLGKKVVVGVSRESWHKVRDDLLYTLDVISSGVFGQDGLLESKLCCIQLDWGTTIEVLTPICNIDSALHYDTMDRVGWTVLEHDRMFSRIDYM